MSTKTLKKRIALVATVALGFGLMSVVPASATNRTVAVQATIASQTGSVGNTTSVQVVSGAISADIDAACAVTYTPTASDVAAGIGTAASTGTELTATNGWGVTATGTGALTMTAAGTYAGATKVLTDGKIVGVIKFTPTASGTYTITVSKTSAGAGCTNVLAAATFTLTVSSAYTTVLGTVVPAIPTVGTAVTIPLKLTHAAETVAAGEATFTATLTAKPANSVRVSADLAAGVTTRESDYETAGASLTSVAATANTLVATHGATAVLVTTKIAGEFVFTPDVPGTYAISILGTDTGAGTPTFTNTATTDIIITVGGAQLTQAANGKGLTTGTAISGGSAVVGFTPFAGDAASTIYNITTTGVGGVTNPIGCASESVAVTASAPRCSGIAVGAVATINGTNYADGIKYTSDANIVTSGLLTTVVKNNALTFDASSTTAGTQTITIKSVALATGVPTTVATVVITWSATAAAASATYSTVFISKTLTGAATANDTVTPYAAKAIGNQVARLDITIKDVNQAALYGQAITAAITGVGLVGSTIGAAATNTNGTRSVTYTALSASTNTAAVAIWSDGTAGTGTVTISVGTVVLATKTVMFYGTVAKLTPTQNLNVARAGSLGYVLGSSAAGSTWATTATTPAVYIAATDSNGNVVPGLTITAVTSDAAVLAGATILQDDATAGDGPGYYNSSVTSAPGGVSGKSATITYRTLLSTGAYITSDAVTFTLGGSLSTGSVAMAFDATSYAPGSAVVLTMTAKDSAGNPVYDQDATVWYSAPVWSKSVQGTLPGLTATFDKGVKKYKLYAPSLDGTFSATGLFADLAHAYPAVVATATVTGNNDASSAAADAAAEATDAANAATDAANAAAEAADAATAAAQDASDAVAALSAQVAEMIAGLKAQLTALTNLVIKIQKKVKA